MDFCRLVDIVFQWLWKHVRTKIIKQQIFKESNRKENKIHDLCYLPKSKMKKKEVTEILQHHGQYPHLHDPSDISLSATCLKCIYTVWVSAKDVLKWLLLCLNNNLYIQPQSTEWVISWKITFSLIFFHYSFGACKEEEIYMLFFKHQ